MAVPPEPTKSPEEELLIVPVPALVAILWALRKEKGSPLTEAEVLACRDSAECIAMPISVAQKIAHERGYEDVDPENVWADWESFRVAHLADDGNPRIG